MPGVRRSPHARTFAAFGTAPGHNDQDAYYVSPPRDWDDPITTGTVPTGRTRITSGEMEGGYAAAP